VCVYVHSSCVKLQQTDGSCCLRSLLLQSSIPFSQLPPWFMSRLTGLGLSCMYVCVCLPASFAPAACAAKLQLSSLSNFLSIRNTRPSNSLGIFCYFSSCLVMPLLPKRDNYSMPTYLPNTSCTYIYIPTHVHARAFVYVCTVAHSLFQPASKNQLNLLQIL